MKSISLPVQSILVIAETDVLVVGRGPGGLAAAIRRVPVSKPC